MNKVILMGRLTRDPEMRQTPNGVPVARFSIAVNRRFAKEGSQTADFINCVAWRQTAEFVCRYFHKGSMIALCGSLQSRSWDGQDGKKQYAMEVLAEDVYFTGSKAESGTTGGGYNNNNTGYTQQTPPNQNQGAQPNFDDFDAMGFSALDGSVDDLPF